MNVEVRTTGMNLADFTAAASLKREETVFNTLVVDVNPIMRLGLCAMLAALPEIRVVAQASGGHSALLASRQHRINLVILDADIEDTNAEEAMSALKARTPDLKVLVGYTNLTAIDAARIVHSGGNGLIARTANVDELTQAIRTVLAGGVYLPARVASQIFRDAPAAAMLPLSGLSPREIDVLRLVAAGYSNKDIARRLSLSVRTVETHRFNLRHKSGMSRPKDLIQLARKLGLRPVDGAEPGAAI